MSHNSEKETKQAKTRILATEAHKDVQTQNCVQNGADTKIKQETTVKIPPKHPANPEISEQKQKDVEKPDVKLATELNVEDIKMILICILLLPEVLSFNCWCI